MKKHNKLSVSLVAKVRLTRFKRSGSRKDLLLLDSDKVGLPSTACTEISWAEAHLLCWRYSAAKQWEFLTYYTEASRDPSQCILLKVPDDDIVAFRILFV